MRAESAETPFCCVCGRPAPLNRHHVVWRSRGELFGPDGRPLPKPTAVLCGLGNHLRDADGRYLCHGLAHACMLHFRCGEGGRLEWLKTDEPTDYAAALGMPGWRPVRM